jgi:hypothetical protein
MKVTMRAEDPTRFDVPVGNYRARLVAIKEMEPSAAHPDWGPSYVWEFEVLSGPSAGKTASCFTKREPTTANNLGRLLAQLLGREVAPQEDVDLSSFLQKEYTVNVGWNKDRTKTRVNSVMPADGVPAGNGPAPVAAVAPPPRQGPPPRPAKVERWYVDGCGEQLFDRAELQKWLDDNHRDPALVEVNLAGSDRWQLASDFGFTNETPF